MSFGSLYISVSGMSASRYSLNTVSHNISNANNPKYVRQSVMYGSNRYRHLGDNIEIGTGVNVSQIRQIRDKFLDIQLRNELPLYGYNFSKSEILANVEGVFNEVSESTLQGVFNEFWDSWNELEKDGESLTARALVHESSVALVEMSNHIGDQLVKIQRDINVELDLKMGEVNSLIDQIAYYNREIVLSEAEGSHISVNDFRDERNELVDRLTELIPIVTSEDGQGGFIVSLFGQELVDGSYVSKLKLRPDPDENTGFNHLYWEATNEKIDLEGLGTIGGYIDVRDKSVTGYKERIDHLISTVAEKVNEIHRRSYDLKGEAGEDFFQTKSGELEFRSDNIIINPRLGDLNKIAVSSRPGEVGNGHGAKEIYNLRYEKILTDGRDEFTVDGYYRDMIGDLGLERQAALNIAKSQEYLILSLDSRRSSLSDVNLDEEMTDMLKFQHAYTANSRVFNTIDEMLDIIVNRVGIVGR